MLLVLQWFASVAIPIWGVAVVILGVAAGNLVWLNIGVIIIGVGLPFLASNPLAARRLYPSAEARPRAR